MSSTVTVTPTARCPSLESRLRITPPVLSRFCHAFITLSIALLCSPLLSSPLLSPLSSLLFIPSSSHLHTTYHITSPLLIRIFSSVSTKNALRDTISLSVNTLLTGLSSNAVYPQSRSGRSDESCLFAFLTPLSYLYDKLQSSCPASPMLHTLSSCYLRDTFYTSPTSRICTRHADSSELMRCISISILSIGQTRASTPYYCTVVDPICIHTRKNTNLSFYPVNMAICHRRCRHQNVCLHILPDITSHHITSSYIAEDPTFD
jgi:hypothetical protein